MPKDVLYYTTKMAKKQSQKIIVVVGPTSSGFSDLGIRLAQKFNGEIISADSRQVYRGMDIGTGKVTKKEQKMAVHHLLDVISPKKQFTADDFKKLGQKAINDVQHRYKIPVIVGGTGFYVDVLLGKASIAEVPPNKKLRAKLEKQSAEQLFKQLNRLDLRRARTIDCKNKRRLIRALEIIMTTNKPVPAIKKQNAIFRVLWLGLRPKDLEKKIKLRLDTRLKQGMVKEVKNLLKSGVSKKRLYDFGLEYRQISEYLASEKPAPYESKASRSGFKVKSVKSFRKSEHYQKLLREIIKYSKRQMTWFKRNKEIHWINPSAEGQKEAKGLVDKFLAD